jgi:hypothetical protein
MIMAAAISSVPLRRRAPALTQQDAILIAGFGSKTGDQVFDDRLKQALGTDLGQWPMAMVPESRKCFIGRAQA